MSFEKRSSASRRSSGARVEGHDLDEGSRCSRKASPACATRRPSLSKAEARVQVLRRARRRHLRGRPTCVPDESPRRARGAATAKPSRRPSAACCDDDLTESRRASPRRSATACSGRESGCADPVPRRRTALPAAPARRELASPPPSRSCTRTRWCTTTCRAWTTTTCAAAGRRCIGRSTWPRRPPPAWRWCRWPRVAPTAAAPRPRAGARARRAHRRVS